MYICLYNSVCIYIYVSADLLRVFGALPVLHNRGGCGLLAASVKKYL